MKVVTISCSSRVVKGKYVVRCKYMKICVPIRAVTGKKAFHKAKLAFKRGADMVEIWLDALSETDRNWLLKHLAHPYIAVLKPKAERGSFTGTDQERIKILQTALNSGADYIDIDFNLAKKTKNRVKKVFKQQRKAKLIISYHNFEKTSDLNALLKIAKQAFSLSADIVKIGVKINGFCENVVLFELVRRIKAEGKKIIAVGMGDKGRISRFGCLILGGYLTYAALDEKERTAEGQMTLRNIKAQMSKVKVAW